MRLLAFLIAVAGAFLLNQTDPPLVKHPNQILAVIGWGLVLLVMPAPRPDRTTWRAVAPLLLSLGLVAAGCAYAWASGRYGQSPALPTLGMLAIAGVLVVHGASWGATDPEAAFRPFAVALAIAGIAGTMIGVVQVMCPDVTDNTFFATTAFPGRAAGNIAQPNQLSDTLLWAFAGLIPLSVLRRNSRAASSLVAIVGLVLLLGMVLTGSRTGLVAASLLAVWGVFDRGLPTFCRRALIATPLVVALLWAAVQGVASWLGVNLTNLAHGDANVGMTAFRDQIWHDALMFIEANPWTGVGWGQFNFAWTLTPIASRPEGFLDNAHNLPLQLAVELGLPCALLIFGALLFALRTAGRCLRRNQGRVSLSAHSAFMMVVLIGLHSMLEFPLWYAHLLLPAAWAWGIALGASTISAAPADSIAAPAAVIETQRLWRVFGLLVFVAGVSAWFDYRNITAIFLPGADAPGGMERIRLGQASTLFARHADYAYAMKVQPAVNALPEIERSAHVLLDMRLLYVWANALAEHGETDKARYIAARMREFQQPETDSFFAPCTDPAQASKLFQCQAPITPLTWRDFR